MGEARTVEAAVRAELGSKLGGPRGFVESALPIAVFTVIYVATDEVGLAAVVAVSAALAGLVVRLAQRSVTRYVGHGILGMALAAAIAVGTGRAETAFLPGIVYAGAVGLALTVSLIVGWPAAGFVIGAVLDDPTGWRRDPAIVRLANRLTLVLLLPMLARVAVQYPLYAAGEVAWLGVARVGLGWPLHVATLAVAGAILARGRTPLEKPSQEGGRTMQAVVHDRYGAPGEVLEPRRIQRPEIDDDDVLVRVRAAGLHVGDCFGVRGSPLPLRMFSGLRRPKYGVPGLDVAGHVEAVGERVERFEPGEEVVGVCRWPSAGACAEYARAAADCLVAKPAALSFEEAAAIPTSALAALHGLRDAGKLRPGQRVLVNGASGGVGTFAVQIAKAFGAEVTGVCGTANLELVRSLGADHVIDYTAQDFARGGAGYDLVLDNVENRSLSEVRRALTPTGTVVLNSGTGARGLKMLVRLLWPLVLSPFVRQRLRRYLSKPNQADLSVLRGLVEAGKLRPVIDRTYPLQEAAAAVQHIETGRARGKVVVTL